MPDGQAHAGAAPGLGGNLLGSLVGSTPIGAIGQGVLGLAQGIIGGIKAKKAQKELENLQTPQYQESKSILDYYNNALKRYNTNPYQSQQYQNATNLAGRSTAAGLNALGGRASAVGGVGRLAALQNEQGLRAGAMAEQDQSQRFGQLGGAAQLQSGEDRAAFQQNKIAPYEKKYNLLAMKAGAANQTANAGISNIFGGLSGVGDYQMAKQIYGQ